jgi:hypothetical protein
MRELTDAELEQASGGQTGGGVITAFTIGGTTNVFHAVPGITKSSTQSGLVPTGHGHVTAAAAQGG